MGKVTPTAFLFRTEQGISGQRRNLSVSCKLHRCFANIECYHLDSDIHEYCILVTGKISSFVFALISMYTDRSLRNPSVYTVAFMEVAGVICEVTKTLLPLHVLLWMNLIDSFTNTLT